MMRAHGAGVLLLACVAALLPGRVAAATRYDPSLRFRSLTTSHFVIHYHQGEEAPAMRLARVAEDVHAALVPRVGPGPSGRTHVVLVNQDDEPNGWATPIPYPLIEVRLTPPEGSSYLGNSDDWLRTVFTHEYAHVLQLGQSRGWAAIPRVLFGRIPLAYPNLSLPLWHIEGLATWEESRAGDGRLHAGDFRAVVTEAAHAGAMEPLDRVNGGLVAWPDGTGWYAYGALFHEYLARRFGEDRLGELSRRTAGRVPYFTSGAFRAVFGESLGSLWRDFEQDRAWHASRVNRASSPTPGTRAMEPPQAPKLRSSAAAREPDVHQLTRDGYLVFGPQYDRDGSIVYSRQGPHDFPSVMRFDPVSGRAGRVTSRYRGERTAVASDGLYFDQLEVDANVALKSDLYRWDRETGDVRRLTHGARLVDPDVSPDGRMVAAVQIAEGARRLVLLDRATLDAGSIRRGRFEPAATFGGPDEIYSAPRFGPDGREIAAERRLRNGASAIVVIDVTTREVTPVITSTRGRNVTPAWSPDGRSIVFASDRDEGPFMLYRARLSDDRKRAASPERLAGPPGGAHSPDVSADGARIVCVGYGVNGFDVFEVVMDMGSGVPAGSGSPRTEALVGSGFSRIDPGSETRSVHPSSISAPESIRLKPDPTAALEEVTDALEGARLPKETTPYSPWSTLWPRAWLPVLQTDDELVRVGATTGGSDALGYHAWTLTTTWAAAVDSAVDAVVSRGRPDVIASYVYDRWRPSIYAQYSDETTPFLVDRLTPAERPVALRERSLDAGVSLPWRRVRVSQALVAGWHRERATIAGPVDRDRADRGALRGGWALQSARRYGYSIGPEDGLAIGAAFEADRPAFGAGNAADLVRLDARGYLPLGPRHAVLAVRASGARTGGHGDSARVLRLGGTDPDGSVLSFDEDATSLLRGFPYATFRGTRVALANMEYRLPLWYVERGFGTWPLFVRALHASGFIDVGSAWTDSFHADDLKRSWGGELSVDVVLGYAMPVTWTVGVAWGRDGAGVVPDNRQVYGRLGVPF